jgi:hypothetical protein
MKEDTSHTNKTPTTVKDLRYINAVQEVTEDTGSDQRGLDDPKTVKSGNSLMEIGWVRNQSALDR